MKQEITICKTPVEFIVCYAIIKTDNNTKSVCTLYHDHEWNCENKIQ